VLEAVEALLHFVAGRCGLLGELLHRLARAHIADQRFDLLLLGAAALHELLLDRGNALLRVFQLPQHERLHICHGLH
jgi:hypothetical protein